MMRAFNLLLTSLCIAASLHGGAARSAEPLKIRVSWIAPITNWASMLLEKKDLAQHLGKSYVLEPVRYVGTPQMITALANGELEIANLAFSTLPIAIENAGLDDLRVIADELQDGVDGYYSQEYMVLADSPIKYIEDLKGRVVATVAAGAAVDVAIRTMLRKHGLEDKRDYTMVEAPLPTMRAMLADKKVDLVPVVLPFAVDPELRRIARTLFYNRDVVGVTQLLVWTARQSFLDKNRAAMVDFMEDTLRITRWYLDPANHTEMTAIASRITKQPAERFDWPFTKRDYYHAPNMLPNLDALQKNVALMKDLGFVKTNVDVKKHSDLGIIEEAAKRLK
jgi:ABC-type nitrate/sulfonate/bicarbonate transport system substrate-binding protein